MGRTSDTEPLGTVAGIWRYPVKSMRGESLGEADLHWTWMHGDRQYAFVKADDRSNFPWLTARDLPPLVLYQSRYVGHDDPTNARVTVSDPAGAMFDIRDPELALRLSEAAGTPVRLLRLGRGAFDAMAVSVLATTAADAVSQAHGSALGVARFRANIVIKPDDPAALETDWLGGSLVFGDGGDPASVGADWATPRCAMVGIDPETGSRDPSVVRTVAQAFGNRLGVYCSVRRPGTIRRGDRVSLAW